MNQKQFCDAVRIAKSDVDLSHADIDIMYGCGLPDFDPVCVTLEQVARHIRWQAQCMDGTWNSEELSEVQRIGRRKFIIIP